MMGSCGRQVLVAEAWCPVSGKARVQAALREVALATSATVRPRPPMCLAAMPTCAARRDPPYSRVLGVHGCTGCPMQPAPTAAPRKRRHAARWCRAPRGARARAQVGTVFQPLVTYEQPPTYFPTNKITGCFLVVRGPARAPACPQCMLRPCMLQAAARHRAQFTHVLRACTAQACVC
jgi:hypothetical protein